MNIVITAVSEHPLGGYRVEGTIDGRTLDYHITDNSVTPVSVAIRELLGQSDVQVTPLSQVEKNKEDAASKLLEKANAARDEILANKVSKTNEALKEFTDFQISEPAEIQDAEAFIEQSKAARFSERINNTPE
jgi:hypothetical protein